MITNKQLTNIYQKFVRLTIMIKKGKISPFQIEMLESMLDAIIRYFEGEENER